ncbi:predicted protein [Aspergillus terreus NIH2624]|uniref:Dioxygenase trt7 n=1 Tax=Aspergillus terreus (strain NIH 2624 / FGSC A1156) TaxID=341663 RepID=TRT7_ASPTN|nr:uncharacterized protein ATEG_10084 [Aspergillus terreus NIH2624]Q0C8A0.1 RecName: Full=Dioxygenase trt7; AltName: Full=Terretonin synthesis protein 7 [Aspergillus terreus NIH2624]EAU29533.1 predicted protein [Aspergillus terreus NIH2624]
MTGQAEAIRRVHPTVSPKQAAQMLQEDGVIILKSFLAPDVMQRFQAEVDEDVEKTSTGARMKAYKLVNDKTKHMADLIVRSEVFRSDILTHPLYHAIADELFRADYGDHWLNASAVLQLMPGAPAQQLHRDEEIFAASKFRSPTDPQLSLSCLVALTEFTEENGATRLIPGSHLWDSAHPAPSPDQTVPAIMQPGEAILFLGSLFHGGGENRTENVRRGLGMSLIPCQFTPYSSHMHVPRTIIETMTPLAQKLVGWRTVESHRQYPFWQGGDRRLEDVLGLASREA